MNKTRLNVMLEQAQQGRPTDAEIRQRSADLEVEVKRLIAQMPSEEELQERIRDLLDTDPLPGTIDTRDRFVGPFEK